MAYKVECAKCGGLGEIKAFSGIAGVFASAATEKAMLS